MFKIFIIIPCYNEAATIGPVVKSVLKYGQPVVIDDGSTDGSDKIAKEAGAKVLTHLINRGQGAALETGHKYASLKDASAVIHFDSDGQHLSEEIPKLLDPIIKNEVEVVLGSRFLQPHKIPFFKKWFILKPAIWFQNKMLNLKLTDAHNGFRSLSKNAFKAIKISQAGMAHASEIIEQIGKNKLSYKEVPVTIIYKNFGQGFLGGFKILRDLLMGKINK